MSDVVRFHQFEDGGSNVNVRVVAGGSGYIATYHVLEDTRTIGKKMGWP